MANTRSNFLNNHFLQSSVGQISVQVSTAPTERLVRHPRRASSSGVLRGHACTPRDRRTRDTGTVAPSRSSIAGDAADRACACNFARSGRKRASSQQPLDTRLPPNLRSGGHRLVEGRCRLKIVFGLEYY